jgi:SagB-type dehydrogenase family enzyme
MAHDIGHEFFLKSKYPNLSPSGQSQDKPQPPIELPYDKSIKPIILPDPSALKLAPVDLQRLIRERRSLRKYAEQLLTLNELSFLLWVTQGVEEVSEKHHTLRTVPSAGARHPFETYLLVNRVESLQPAVYRYLAIEHQLIPYLQGDYSVKLAEACRKQNHIQTSAVTFFWSVIPYRTTWRYSERGYRYILLDAGHVCQNLYIAAESIGCGICAIAAYDDDAVNGLLKQDGSEQFIIYIASLGKKVK